MVSLLVVLEPVLLNGSGLRIKIFGGVHDASDVLFESLFAAS